VSESVQPVSVRAAAITMPASLIVLITIERTRRSAVDASVSRLPR
jgi:hypothetical protein